MAADVKDFGDFLVALDALLDRIDRHQAISSLARKVYCRRRSHFVACGCGKEDVVPENCASWQRLFAVGKGDDVHWNSLR